MLNSTDEIASGADLRVAVCTTSYSHRNLESGWFLMPTGHPTGLKYPSVVKATWIERVPQAEVISILGRAPRQIFKQVLNWLADEERKKRATEHGTKKPT